MLKFYKILVLLILLAGSRQLISQSTLLNPITTLIDKSKAGNKLPTIIDNAGNTRGAGFNGENIFVATRTGEISFITGMLPSLMMIPKP